MSLLRGRKWLLYTILAALSWGVWGIFSKVISEVTSPYLNHFLFTIGLGFTLPFTIRKCKWKEVHPKGLIWGIVAGVVAILGNIAVYKAFAHGGQAAVVIPVTNLYPLVTILVALLFLKERITWVNVLGIFFAIPAIIILSGEELLFTDPEVFFKSFNLEGWFIFSILALVFWGLFSAFQKIATNYISAQWSYLGFIIASFLMTGVFALMGQISLNIVWKIFVLGVIAGLLNGLGVLSSFNAYSAEGKATLVTTIAGSLQPVFTVILAVAFLNEKITGFEYVGIGLTIFGGLLLSNEGKKLKINLRKTDSKFKSKIIQT